jgi:diacylglycerol kinase family enzyme
MWSLMLCSFDGAGEGLMLAPGADPGDRKLDLIMVGEMGRWESLTKIVPNLGDGSYLAHPKVSRRHATRITIDSDQMVRADVDGESIGKLPMSVTMLPFHLKVAALDASPARA